MGHSATLNDVWSMLRSTRCNVRQGPSSFKLSKSITNEYREKHDGTWKLKKWLCKAYLDRRNFVILKKTDENRNNPWIDHLLNGRITLCTTRDQHEEGADEQQTWRMHTYWKKLAKHLRGFKLYIGIGIRDALPQLRKHLQLHESKQKAVDCKRWV